MSNSIDFIQTLEEVVAQRKTASTDDSYTARLYDAGVQRIAQKVGEEGVELALAGVQGDREAITAEAADLIYHVIVLLQASGLSLADISAELQRRHG